MPFRHLCSRTVTNAIAPATMIDTARGAMTEIATKTAPSPKFKPGEMVNAMIGKKARGPFYLVQIADGLATLQGKESIEVPVSDLRPAGD